MKKYIWVFFILIIIVGIAVAVFSNQYLKPSESNYKASRTQLELNENVQTNIDNRENKEEKEISEFSTKLPKDTKARYSNIALACSTLNETIIKAGQTFSLWSILGCPTPEKGYRKAKTFTSGGKVKQSYGGGICQVSTTIYNAVKEAEGLEIVERHEHSRDVVYIKDGKDAAVSYKSGDFRFKNTFDYDIKLEAKLEDNRVKITLVRI